MSAQGGTNPNFISENAICLRRNERFHCGAIRMKIISSSAYIHLTFGIMSFSAVATQTHTHLRTSANRRHAELGNESCPRTASNRTNKTHTADSERRSVNVPPDNPCPERRSTLIHGVEQIRKIPALRQESHASMWVYIMAQEYRTSFAKHFRWMRPHEDEC